jgi:hypothetical protein
MANLITNRQMAARLRKLGFRKSDIALSRNAHYWVYPDTNALFFYSKSEHGGVAASCPDHKTYSFPLGLTAEKFDQFCEMGVEFPIDENGELTVREALLAIAAHFADNIENEQPEPAPDSIMGIMNNIKQLADEIEGGA